MNISDVLSKRRVPAELLTRMMQADAGQLLEPDMPPAPGALDELEAQLGELPADYREWIARFGAASTPDESGIIFGLSVSSYKTLGPRVGEALQVASFDEGDDRRYLDEEGGVASTSDDAWYPCFASFVAAVLCQGNAALREQFASELEALEVG